MINQGRLSELRDEIGDADLAEVAEMFLAEAAEVIDKICASNVASTEDMHFLKGSAMNLGLQALGDLCSDAESRMRADPSHQPDFAAIRGLFNQSQGALQAALRGG